MVATTLAGVGYRLWRWLARKRGAFTVELQESEASNEDHPRRVPA
jgi:hypothetical protein